MDELDVIQKFMRSKTQLQALPRITDIGIGIEESAVVQVEAGEATGYLIAAACAVGELPSELTLTDVIYFCARGGEVEIAETACAGYGWSEVFYSPRKQIQMMNGQLGSRHGLNIADIVRRNSRS